MARKSKKLSKAQLTFLRDLLGNGEPKAARIVINALDCNAMNDDEKQFTEYCYGLSFADAVNAVVALSQSLARAAQK